jgi:hypothetical protein
MTPITNAFSNVKKRPKKIKVKSYYVNQFTNILNADSSILAAEDFLVPTLLSIAMHYIHSGLFHFSEILLSRFLRFSPFLYVVYRVFFNPV